MNPRPILVKSERIASVECLVPNEPEQAAMTNIRARFRGDIDEASGGAAKFR
jgi:hypothetical protein